MKISPVARPANHKTNMNINLEIEIFGGVKANNLAEVMPAIRAGLAKINRAPVTDEEFGQAEADIKTLKEVEAKLAAAKEKALADAVNIRDLFAAVDAAADEIRVARLSIEKAVSAEKDRRRDALVAEALETLPKEARKTPQSRKIMDAAVKGKRTIESMRKALVEAARIESERIEENRAQLREFAEANGMAMLPDWLALLLGPGAAIAPELQRRIDAAEAEEARKAAAEEAAKEQARLMAIADEARKQAAAEMPKVEVSDPVSGAGIYITPQRVIDNIKADDVPTESDEWADIKAVVIDAFLSIKEAKECAKHQANIDRLNKFGAAVNVAWKEVQP